MSSESYASLTSKEVFNGLVISFAGNLPESRKIKYTQQVASHGGKVVSNVDDTGVTHIVALRLTDNTVTAEAAGTPIVRITWLKVSIKRGSVAKESHLYLANAPASFAPDDQSNSNVDSTSDLGAVPDSICVFNHLVFCMSYVFISPPNGLKNTLEQNGGKVVETVDKNVSYLVVLDGIGSSKTAMAKEYGIPLVTEAWVHESIRNGGTAMDAHLYLANPPEEIGWCMYTELEVPQGTKCFCCSRDLGGIILLTKMLKCPDCNTETYAPRNPTHTEECRDDQNALLPSAFTYGMFHADSWLMKNSDPYHRKGPFYWPLFMIGSPQCKALGGQDRAQLYRWMDHRIITWSDGMEGHHYLFANPRKGKSVVEDPETFQEWKEAVKALQKYMAELKVEPASDHIIAAAKRDGFRPIRLARESSSSVTDH